MADGERDCAWVRADPQHVDDDATEALWWYNRASRWQSA